MHKTIGSLVVQIRAIRRKFHRPIIVSIDGRSGAGKSTLAAILVEALGSAVTIDGDDFFAGGPEISSDSPESRAAGCIDWLLQRSVLISLRRGRAASYRAFDWEAFDGRLCSELTKIEARPVIILEGTYSARPELADLVDFSVLLCASDDVRIARLLNREGPIGPWDTQWHEAEDWYFNNVVSNARFNVVVDNS